MILGIEYFKTGEAARAWLRTNGYVGHVYKDCGSWAVEYGIY